MCLESKSSRREMRSPVSERGLSVMLWCHPVVCSLHLSKGFVSRERLFEAILNLFTATGRVCICRKNDHAGGQGRIYTSNLNFVSTHLSQPSHRRGCCCMPPKCHPRQCVACCLLSCALFVVKIVLLCFARFLSKWRETALWMFLDATQAGYRYELYV